MTDEETTPTVRLQVMLNIAGHRYGDYADFPDTEATWQRVAAGTLRVPEEPYDYEPDVTADVADAERREAQDLTADDLVRMLDDGASDSAAENPEAGQPGGPLL